MAGKPCTRIIDETVTGDDRRVLDFASTYRDDGRFDIASTYVGSQETVNLMVISGTRKAGDATTFALAARRRIACVA